MTSFAAINIVCCQLLISTELDLFQFGQSDVVMCARSAPLKCASAGLEDSVSVGVEFSFMNEESITRSAVSEWSHSCYV